MDGAITDILRNLTTISKLTFVYAHRFRFIFWDILRLLRIANDTLCDTAVIRARLYLFPE